MANRYWVGGSATWDATAGTKWAATDGGPGGQTVPTVSDNVYFTALSGAVTVTVSAANAFNLDFTGFTGTLAGTVAITIAGGLTFSSTMTRTHTGQLTFNATSGSYNVYTNGLALANNIAFAGAGGGTWNIMDTLTSTGLLSLSSNSTLNINANITLSSVISHTNGTINFNNGVTVTTSTFTSNNSVTRAINLGSSTLILTGTGNAWSTATTTGLTFNAGTSRIVFTNTASPATAVTFAGGGLTFYTVQYARGAATANYNVTGNNTFVNFIDNSSTVAHQIVWPSFGTNTFYRFIVKGSSGALITFTKSSTGTCNLVKVGQGPVCCDYVTNPTTNTTVTPANTWYVGANGGTVTGGWVAGNCTSSQSLLGIGGVG